MSEQGQKPVDPIPTMEDKWYWEAADRGEFLGERCSACQTFRHPPQPMCPRCHSLEHEHVALSGNGVIDSWVMPVHPRSWGFDEPPIVVLVMLDEGYRVLGNLLDTNMDDVEMGMPVKVAFQETSGGHQLPVFKPAD